MSDFSPLNGLQRMMLRWEEFHPLNAAHVVELGRYVSPPDLLDIAGRVCRRLGLGPVEFCPRRNGFRYEEPSADDQVPFVYLELEDGTLESLSGLLNAQLNSRFPAGPHWPLHFLLVETTGMTQFLILVYHHVVADSRSISTVLREVLRAVYRRPAAISRLRTSPAPLEQLFPSRKGLKGLTALGRECLSEVRSSATCRRRLPASAADPSIRCLFHESELPIDQLRKNARSYGATIQDLLFAALLEAFGALEDREAGAGDYAIYAPVDLRREASESLDDALGQLLGCMTVRTRVTHRGSFRSLIDAVATQTRRLKADRSYRTHANHMRLMANCWDYLPQFVNRVLGPRLFPVMGFISNVNLTDFLAEERKLRQIRSYRRVSGTGILTPMMLGFTTLGDVATLTTTHHGHVFSDREMIRVAAHVQQRLLGELADVAGIGRILEVPATAPVHNIHQGITTGL